MPVADLAIRFTEETYATKADVARALGTSVVEPIWQTIEAYRQSFERVLRLTSIDKQPLRLILTPSLLERIHRLERLMLKALGRIQKANAFTNFTSEQKAFLIPVLQPLAKRYGASTSERKLGYIIDQKPIEEPGFDVVQHYFHALSQSVEKRMSPLNEEWILAMLTHLHGTDNLPSFYREKELTDRPKSLVARIYEAAPYPQIESLMTTLIQYVENTSYSSLLVAMIACFYVDYVKPFESFNDEMSVLTCKNILMQSGWESLAAYLPIEGVMDAPAFSSICQEVQKTKDVTYFVMFLLPIFEDAIHVMLNQWMQTQIEVIQQEQRQPDPSPLVTHLPSEPISPSVHQEIDANRYQTSLLETHPSMRKAEAYFYARHREKGKFYTIAQFKTLMGCAYETARTSMEHLVELGYYRKEQYKNKYVYTPQGD
jgi:hypothetical protein